MLDTQAIKELWESSTQSMWPRTGKFTAGSNQQNLIDFAESVAQKILSEKQSLRDIIAISQLAALTSIYWKDSDLYASGKDLIKCQCENAYEYADMMLLEQYKQQELRHSKSIVQKEITNELNIINAV